jgi:hypothetical protein
MSKQSVTSLRYYPCVAPKQQALIVSVFVLFLGLPLAYAVYEHYVLMFPMGAACHHNKQCRGLRSVCLPTRPTRTSILGTVEFPDEGEPGVCTHPCEADADCPTDMSCIDAVVYEHLPGQHTSFGGPDHAAKVCAPRRD